MGRLLKALALACSFSVPWLWGAQTAPASDLHAPSHSKREAGKNVGRAATEFAAMQTTAFGMKLALKGTDTSGWRYQPNWADMQRKATDGWSFDTNTFAVNFLGHPYSGALYYQVGRGNGLSPIESAAFAFAGSLVWEYVSEYGERVSANDMIFTTAGGVILGESLFRASLAVDRSRLHPLVRKPLAFLLDPLRALNAWMDGR